MAEEIAQGGTGDDVIVLRPYEPSDAWDLFEAARESIPDMRTWMPWCHDRYALVDSEQYIERTMHDWHMGLEYSFCIRSAVDATFLGGCGINRIDAMYQTGNLGYWVRSSHTCKGIATRATQLLARWAFDTIPLRRIEVICGAGNHPSRRVAEHVGAVEEGRLRARLLVDGVPHDAILYSLLTPNS